MNDNRPLMTAEQVAERLNVNVYEVWKLGRQGKLPRIVLSRKMVRFDPDDVQAYIDNKREQVIDWKIDREIPF